MAYGSFVLMRDMSFTINHGDVFIIMGGSGTGKSTLLRHLIGLNEPARVTSFTKSRTLPGRTRHSDSRFSGASESRSKAAPYGAR